MAESNDPRFGIHRWSADTDTPSRDEFDATFGALATLATGYTESTLALRPAPGRHGWWYFITSGPSIGKLYYDTGTDWLLINPDFGADADIDGSLPGDTSLAGSTGRIADAGHRHAREGFGASVALTRFGLGKSNGVAGSLSRSDHTHGTPAIGSGGAALPARSLLNFVIPSVVGSISDDGGNDETTVTLNVQPMPIAFHIGQGLTAGLKKPRWIAPVNCTIVLARAMVDAGSGVTYQLYLDGAAATPASAAIGTAVVLTDFADFNVDAGHAVQINISNAGAGASDLSVTALAYPR